MSLKNSYYWTTDYPNMRIDVTYSQTARTGTSATYKVNMAVYFTSSGWHGYGLSAKCTINGTAQTLRIKEPSNSWSGSGHKGTWTFTITASAGASGGTLPASIQLWGTDGDTTNINSGSKTVSLSTWNTAPTWTGEGNVNGWTSAQIMAENTSSVTVNFPSARDNEGNTLRYDVWRYVNGSSNAKIATGSTAKSLTDNISGFGQGSRIKYLFKVSDGSLWASGDKWTVEHTKNTFTPANVSASGGIGYSTSSITLTVSGAKNTNGNTTFSYRVFSPDGLTVFNETFSPNSSGQVTFSIYSGSGTRPSNPHIDFSELKAFVAKGTYKGTLVLRVQTNNAYGSSGSKEVSVAVDLRTNPVPAGLGNPTGAVTVAGGSYFVHNLSTVGISWSGASDRLGAGALTYELQYKYGTGSWNRLTTTTGTSWSGKLATVTSATTCYFRVIATTTYGYSATSAEKSITMHYYNPPKVSYRSPNRTTSEFSVYIDSSTNTSITAVAISSRTFTGIAGTAKSFTGSATLITDTGLTGDSTYNVVVKVTDNSGLSNATTTINVPVTAYIPIMSITNKGIAISTTADPAYKLNIGGSLSVVGDIRLIDPSSTYKSGGIFTYKGDGSGMGLAIQSGGATVIGSGESAMALMDTISNKSDEVLHLTSDSSINIVTNCQTIGSRVTSTFSSNGNLVIPKTFITTNSGSGAELLRFNTERNWVFKQGGSGSEASLDLQTITNSKSFRLVSSNGTPRVRFTINDTADSQFIIDGSIHINGNNLIAFGNGGGWNMVDTTWIRSYGDKQVYINKLLRTDGGFQVGASGSALNVTTDGTVTASGSIGTKSTIKLTSSPSEYSRFGYETSSGDTYISNGANNWLRLKTDKTMTYAGYTIYTTLNKGDIATVATRISNLNTRLNSGWYAWSNNATGRPTDYGVMLVIQWGTNSDFCQIAVGTNNAMWTRWYVNGAWTGWVLK